MKVKILKEDMKVKVLTYVMLFIVLYGVTNVNIYYSHLLPFGIGLVFALLYFKYNGYYLSIVYLLAYTLSGLMFVNIVEGLFVGCVLIFSQMLIDKKKLTLCRWKVFVLVIISQSLFIFNNLGVAKENLALFVAVVISIIFLYISICFFEGVKRRGFSSKLNIDEKICGCLMAIIFMMGMGYTNISIINVGMIFASILILTFTYLFSISNSILVGSLIGISYSIITTNYLYISLFVVLCLCGLLFKKTYRIFSAISIVLGYMGFSVIFNSGIAWGEVISLAIGSLIFMFVPKKYLDKITQLFSRDKKLLVADMLNNTKNYIVKRVEELSNIFGEMEGVYKDMVRGNLPDNVAKDMIKEEVILNVCKNCSNYDMCFRGSGSFTENSFNTLVDIGYEKNKILLIDMPQYLTTNCINVGGIVEYFNNTLSSYKDYVSSISNLDSSRVIIADQLMGVSRLLKSLSNEVDINIKNENKLSGRIVEELEYNGIACVDCYVFEKSDRHISVNIIVKDDELNDNKIVKIVNKIIKLKVCVVEKKPSDISGYDIITLENAPNYNIIYGCATTNKLNKKVSGDSHSVIKLENGKYLISICDGMGSGERANKISKLTISLIEKFYRAGFDNDCILNTINKLLSLSEEENYSTIDLCVIDGKKNYYDFIKLGGCKSYILRENGEVELIESSGLPVGILEDIKPHTTRKLINPMDILVFLSDGVADILGEGIASILRHSNCVNPKTLSEKILKMAIEKSGNVSADDMTVICVRSVLFV